MDFCDKRYILINMKLLVCLDLLRLLSNRIPDTYGIILYNGAIHLAGAILGIRINNKSDMSLNNKLWADCSL